MSITWPEHPGPDDWYLEVAPETPIAGSHKFSKVWFRIKCKAFPAHVCDFKAIALDNLRFDWQFDLAFKQAKNVVTRLNLGRTSEVEERDESDVPCAECDKEHALTDDYLCEDCRARKG